MTTRILSALILSCALAAGSSCSSASPSCEGRPADEIHSCTNNPDRVFCLDCSESCLVGEGASTTQCSVTTGDGDTFDCNTCDGNNGCFDFENEDVAAFCDAP